MDDAAARETEIPEPTLLVMEFLSGDSPKCTIACDRKVIIRDVPGMKAPLLLRATYYGFNIKEPKGFTSFLKFVYIFLFNIEVAKQPCIVTQVLSMLR